MAVPSCYPLLIITNFIIIVNTTSTKRYMSLYQKSLLLLYNYIGKIAKFVQEKNAKYSSIFLIIRKKTFYTT
jgi:hypothetical protein